jgi:hypothetical protein
MEALPRDNNFSYLGTLIMIFIFGMQTSSGPEVVTVSSK